MTGHTPKTRNDGQRPWSFRRCVVIAALIFCASAIAICLIMPAIAPEVATTAISGAFSLGGAVIGAYIFGAVWHDRGRRT